MPTMTNKQREVFERRRMLIGRRQQGFKIWDPACRTCRHWCWTPKDVYARLASNEVRGAACEIDYSKAEPLLTTAEHVCLRWHGIDPDDIDKISGWRCLDCDWRSPDRKKNSPTRKGNLL